MKKPSPEIGRLACYRMTRAEEILGEAETLYQAGYIRGAVNRYYYAMFHAARALLALRQLDSPKHSGVIALFNLEFVKSGIVARDMGRKLKMAFDLRIEGDYRDEREFSMEELLELKSSAESFIASSGLIIEDLLRQD